MKRVQIQSDKLLSIGYDAELQVLEVEFSDHTVYQLVKVSAEVYTGLMNASDKNDYFEKFIRFEYAGQRVYP